jgi:hypothetical protein
MAEELDPELRLRIRRVTIISGVWLGFIILSAGAFLVSRPYLDKRREQRIARGQNPLVFPKHPARQSAPFSNKKD